VETATKLQVRIQHLYLEIELTLVNVEPESQLHDSCGANSAPEDVLNGGCKTLLKDPKQVSSVTREAKRKQYAPLRKKENNANICSLIKSLKLSFYGFVRVSDH
jgi:hypothetical protein